MTTGGLRSGTTIFNSFLFVSHSLRCRAIYDNDEHIQFREKLIERIKHHDKDIERLCNVYYQGFIESVRELLEVRTQAKKLNVIISY